ncbi:MAG TPA: hypothetical protein VH111_01520, partial [Steroidobacteraceae bacterium]|nr:hypothetical protein [Steroidobacteraceae bacterium]
MQFLLFDLSATLVFLAGYLTVVTLQRRLLVSAAIRRPARPGPQPEREPGRSKPAPAREDCQNCLK